MMARRQQVAVIGLGRFGSSVCERLAAEDVDVLAIDMDDRRVQDLAPVVAHAVRADSTDERVLTQLAIETFDQVVVAIGEDIQASILTALLVKQRGAEQIWAKAKSDYHAKVLELIGVDRVVHPEREMGDRIAQLLASESLVDFIELSGEHRLVELSASSRIDGSTLRELDLRARYGCIVIGYQRGGHTEIPPDPDWRIHTGDILFLVGDHAQLRRFQEFLGS